MLVARIYRYGRVQYGPGSVLGPRATIGHEFVRILKGKVRWVYDGIAHDLGPGSFLLSQPGHTETYHWDPRGLTRHDYLHFDLTPAGQRFLPSPATWPIVAQVAPQEVLHALFQHVISVLASGHPASIEVMRLATEQMLMTWVLGLRRAEGFPALDVPPAVQIVIDDVYARWARGACAPPSIDAMVQQAGLARSSFMRLSEQVLGMGPVRFFELQRLHFARLLLLESGLSITAIAERLCYPNPFQFSRSFRRQYGVSPREFRARPTPEDDRTRSIIFQQVAAILAGNQVI